MWTLLILAACGAKAPTEVVFQFGLVQERLPLDRLKHNDVALGWGCEVGELLGENPGALIVCGETSAVLRCHDHPKQEHLDLSVQGKGFGVWCE